MFSLIPSDANDPQVLMRRYAPNNQTKSRKNLRSGDLLIQCAKESHEKNLLQMKTFVVLNAP